MADLGTLTARPVTRKPPYTPPPNFHGGRMRHNGVLSGGRVGTLYYLNSISGGIRSGSPYEAAPPLGKLALPENAHLTFLLWAAAGLNTVTLPVEIVGTIINSPTLAVLASDVLPTPPAPATINPAGLPNQNLVLAFTTLSAGRVSLIVKWFEPAYNSSLNLGALNVA